jgi:autoinducer 2-degrading protein
MAVILHVTFNVKPDNVKDFLEVARYDAEHSVADEPGCLRFEVIQDKDDPNKFYFQEAYRDDAALAAHRETPHFKHYAEKSPPWLASPPERRLGTNLHPSEIKKP